MVFFPLSCFLMQGFTPELWLAWDSHQFSFLSFLERTVKGVSTLPTWLVEDWLVEGLTVY